jgi:HSP20 family protein
MFLTTYKDFGNLLSEKSTFIPRVNTREDKDNYYIEIDMPGLNQKDINLEVKNNMLVISGERKFKNEIKEDNYYRLESSFGQFSRSFSLPENIDSDNITAEFKNGVLDIHIPKTDSNDVKKIEIKQEE